MNYIIIGMCILAVVIIIALLISLLIYRKKKANDSESVHKKDDGALIPRQMSTPSQPDKNPDELIIQMELLPEEVITDKEKLVEITDNKILAHINNLVPGLAQAGIAAKNAVQAAKTGGGVLYRAVVPSGAKLANSQAMKGAARAIYHGANGKIQGQANLVPVKTQSAAANALSSAMGLASMVVGQYYMKQINTELVKISDSISKISDFQDNEFRSRVFSLVTHINKITEFKSEILENDELRQSKIAQLYNLEEECTKLLGQANLTLSGFTKKNDLDYESYEKEVKKADNWCMYQKSLLDVLYEISDLRFTLHMGNISMEQCMALVPTYAKQVEDTRKLLTDWHQTSVNRLGIDIEEAKRKRDGFDGMIHFFPGLFNDDLNFTEMDETTISMITAQSSGQAIEHPHTTANLYEEDVQLISKDGKIYYLPI